MIYKIHKFYGVIITFLILASVFITLLFVFNLLSENFEKREIIHPISEKKFYIIRIVIALDPAFYYITTKKPNKKFFFNKYYIDTSNSIKIYEDFCYNFSERDLIIYSKHFDKKLINNVTVKDVAMYDCDTSNGFKSIFNLFNDKN